MLAYAGIFAVMATLTWLAPICSDDFRYWPGKNFTLPDIFAAEKAQYLNWGGRSVAHFFLRLLLGAGRPAYFLLPLSFTGTLFLAQILLWGRDWREQTRWWHPLVLFMFVWLFTRGFGEAYLWRTGAANYCLPLFFGLLFLVPFRFLLDDPTWRLRPCQAIPLALVALFAGWSNETAAPPIFLAASAAILQARIRGGRWPRWAIAYWLLCLAGCLFLFLAPGNYSRLHSPDFADWHALAPWQKISIQISALFKEELFVLPLSLLVLAGAWAVWKQNRDSLFSAVVRPLGSRTPAMMVLLLYLLAQFSLLILFASPSIPPRALTTADLFFCMAATGVFAVRCLPKQLGRLCGLCLVLTFCMSFVITCLYFERQHQITLEREQLFATSRTPAIPPYLEVISQFVPVYDWHDPRGMQRYYGVDSFSTRATKIGPLLCQKLPGATITVQREERNSLSIHYLPDDASTPDSGAPEIEIYYERPINSLLALFRFLLHRVIDPFLRARNSTPQQENMRIFYSDFSSNPLLPGKPRNFTTLHGASEDIRFFSIRPRGSTKRLFVKAELSSCAPGESHAP